jgi:beta-N-acetylhexosaminidase
MRRRGGCSTGMAWPRRNGDLPHSGTPPDIDVVGSADHLALAGELAARSITLVRDPGGLLPGPWSEVERVLAVMPRPTDLTPADTSSTVAPGLAAALRRYHGDVDEVVVEPEPDAAAIAAVRSRAEGADLAVVGTIDGHRLRSQLKLVEAVVATGTPTIAVAMRGPWDVSAYPPGVTALATFSILPGSLDALAAVLAGEAEARDRLPVTLATA